MSVQFSFTEFYKILVNGSYKSLMDLPYKIGGNIETGATVHLVVSVYQHVGSVVQPDNRNTEHFTFLVSFLQAITCDLYVQNTNFN